MLNMEMGAKATETAINSQGSAMREQEIFATGLEARINRLQNAWTGLAATAGDSIIYDSIVVLTNTMQGLTNAGDSAIGGWLGALAPIFGTIATAAIFFSGTLRGLVVQKYAAVTAAVAQAGATGFLGTVMGIATVAAGALATAIRVLLTVALPVGVAFATLGFVIEKFTSAMSDNIQQQEKIDTYVHQNTEALTTNKEAVDGLIAEYTRLSEARKGDNWDSTKEQEYLRVQQQLGDFYPALIDHIDATGQTRLKNVDAVNKEIKATQELLKLKQEELKLNAKDVFADNIKANDKIKSQIESNTKTIKQYQKEADSGSILYDVNDKLKNIARLRVENQVLESEFADSSKQIQASIYDIANAYSELEIDSNVSKSLQEFVGSLDVSNLNTQQLEDFSKIFSDIQDKFQEAVNKDDAKIYDEATKSLNDLAKEFNLIDDDVSQFNVTAEKFFETINKGNGVIIDGEAAVDELAVKVYELKSATEALAGVSQQQVDDTTELLFMYEALSIQLAGYTEEELKNLALKPNLTAEEKALIATYQQREGVMSSLLAIYPDLLDADGKSILSSKEKIKAMEQENKANEVLLKAYKLSADGKLTAEQKATLAQAQGTKARIDNIKLEIQALNLLQKQLQAYYDEQAKKIDPNDNSYTAGYGAYRSGTVLGQTQSQVTDYTSELATLQSQLNGNIGTIDNYSTAIEKSEKASKKSNKETEKSIYITDKYKQAMEALTLEIEKQQRIQSKFPTYTQEYQKSLEKQIKLEKEKLALQQAQGKALQSQISSGKIQQTGNVKVSNSANNVSSNQTNLGGAFAGRRTSAFGTRSDNHRGEDFAAPRGTRVNATTAGKVIASGSASANGMHSSYGNLVVVQDANNIKHIYAHLDKAVAKIGETVQRGSFLGEVGSTGNSTGNHLHYEVNVNGKPINPNSFITNAKNEIVQTNAAIGATVATGTEAIDGAKSNLTSINSDILQQLEHIEQLEFQMIEAQLSAFEYRRQKAQQTYDYEEAKLKNVDKFSSRYTKTLDIQAQQLKYRQSANEEELAFVDKLLKSNTLTANNQAEMKKRYNEIKTAIQETNNELAKMDLRKFEVNLVVIERMNNLLEYNTVVMESLSKGTERYQKALKLNTEYLSNKQKVNKEELDSLQKMIYSGKYSGEVMEEMTARVQELQVAVRELALEIQENNFEIIMDIKTNFDEAQDDLQYAIDRSDIIKGSFDEGSKGWKDEIEKQIELYGELAKSQDNQRRALQAELKSADITAERIKEITELLEDQTLAYLNTTMAVDKLKQELIDTEKQLKKEIADQLNQAYKDYVGERRDEHMKMLDDEAKAEAKRHEERKKQLKDEMDLFRKNVEERLQLIDRQEAERGYNMEIDEMEKERSKIQGEIDVLSLDDSREAKSKRKKLQEQLDKIDKDIAEKRHDRDIELQKQGLNDLLESKEQEINGKIELEDEQYQAVVDRIDKEKRYWEKHYTDLLNDERKFAQLREDILNGHFDKVEAEFQQYIQQMIDTMPLLEDTMDGTMTAVGTSIRQNVIDALNDAIAKIGEFNNLSTSIGSNGTGKPGISDDFNPNDGKNNIVSGSVDKNNPTKGMTEADMMVLFAKYMREQLVALEPNDKNKQILRDKADNIASQGRKGGSKISADVSMNTALAGFDRSEYQRFSNYILTKGIKQVSQASLQEQIRLFGNRIASMDTGGMTKFSGRGMDGKGGKLIMAHDGEVVNNPLETSQLLKTAIQSNSLFDKLRSVISPMLTSIPNLSTINNRSIGGDTFEINLNGTFPNTSQSKGKEFGEAIGNAILTTKGGVW